MTTITKGSLPTDRPELNIGAWVRNQIFSSVWRIIGAIILVGLNVVIIQTTFFASPIELSFMLAPNGEPTAIGNIILLLTDAKLLTSIVVLLWVAGVGAVIYSFVQNRWTVVSQWLKDSLFTGFFSTLVTLFLTIVIVFSIRSLLAWGVFGALFSSNPEAVEILRDVTPGAIWGVVGANLQLFAIGRYPLEYAWRVGICLGAVFMLMGLSMAAWNFGSPLKKYRRWIVYGWFLSYPFCILMLSGFGESGPMAEVSTSRWGGFLLTVFLSVSAIVFSFPIGVLLALGRRGDGRGIPYLSAWGAILLLMYWIFLGGFPTETQVFNIPLIFLDPPLWTFTLSPIQYALVQAVVVIGLFWTVGYFLGGNLIKTFCIAYIEVIRGVPLITVLVMANIMFPFFLPKGLEIDNLLRVTVGLIMFSAAYLAENVRGGLQSIPKGQYEAAMALGLSTPQSMRLIILPQALRAVIPAIVGQFISLFKDTSLVSIVGLFDLLKIAQAVISQPDWLGLQKEAYVFVGFIYWIFSYSMSISSRKLERNLGVGER